jgi:hypothetical protein
MRHIIPKVLLVFAIAAAVWVWDGGILPTSQGNLIATAEAVVGMPATPVSYAGVARRSTVGAGAPGAGAAPHAGVGAPGAGAAPANRGGPVNRVGAR